MDNRRDVTQGADTSIQQSFGAGRERVQGQQPTSATTNPHNIKALWSSSTTTIMSLFTKKSDSKENPLPTHREINAQKQSSSSLTQKLGNFFSSFKEKTEKSDTKPSEVKQTATPEKTIMDTQLESEAKTILGNIDNIKDSDLPKLEKYFKDENGMTQLAELLKNPETSEKTIDNVLMRLPKPEKPFVNDLLKKMNNSQGLNLVQAILKKEAVKQSAATFFRGNSHGTVFVSEYQSKIMHEKMPQEMNSIVKQFTSEGKDYLKKPKQYDAFLDAVVKLTGSKKFPQEMQVLAQTFREIYKETFHSEQAAADKMIPQLFGLRFLNPTLIGNEGNPVGLRLSKLFQLQVNQASEAKGRPPEELNFMESYKTGPRAKKFNQIVNNLLPADKRGVTLQPG